MSTHVIARVWETSKHKGTKLLVMLALAEYSGPEGICWPGIPTLAKMIRVKDTRWIRRTLRELEESGELVTLTSTGGHGVSSTSLYFIALMDPDPDAIATALMVRRGTSKAEAKKKGGEITLLLQKKGGDGDPPRGGEPIQEVGSPSPPDPLLSVIEPLLNPQAGDSVTGHPVRAVPKPAPRQKKPRSGFGRQSKPKTKNNPICPLHGVTMFPRDGGARYSHQLVDGTWCSGVEVKKTETFEEYAARLDLTIVEGT